MSQIKLARCICPNGHTQLAAAAQGDWSNDRVAFDLALKVAELMMAGVLETRCGECGAPPDTWIGQVADTDVETLEEAVPELLEAGIEYVLLEQRQAAAKKQAVWN